MTPFVPAAPIDNVTPEDFMARFKVGLEEAQRMVETVLSGEMFVNDVYQVHRRGPMMTHPLMPLVFHLSIKRHDKEPCRDWRDFQQIKNELVGPEHEGVEVFPAESRLVDMANQYHLWVFAYAGMQVPVGWQKRMVWDEVHADLVGAKQRQYDQPEAHNNLPLGSLE